MLQKNYPDATINFQPLQDAITQFIEAANEADITVQESIARNDTALTARDTNSWLSQTERQFLDSAGLPDRPWYKHPIQAPGILLGYGSEVYPGLQQAIRAQDWNMANQQVNAIAARVRAAANHLDSDSSSDDTTVIIVVSVLVGFVVLLVVITCIYRKLRSQGSIEQQQSYGTLE